MYARHAASSAVAPLLQQCSKLTQDWRDFSVSHETRLSACEKVSAAHLAAELAALAGDVERLATSSRKQFGKVFAELHHSGTLKRNVESQLDVEQPHATDPELEALLALQSSSVTPPKANGGA